MKIPNDIANDIVMIATEEYSDPNAASRRAIVRAAGEIGKIIQD